MLRTIATVVTYLAVLAAVAAIVLIVVLFVAGPHSGLLPHWAEVIVLIIGWTAVVLLPVLAARAVWRRWR